MTTAAEIRAKYWRLRNLMERTGQVTPTLDREISLTQLELLAELTAQMAEANSTLARIGVLNFEELALRLEDFFKKHQD